jgi:hypothetical protein
VGESEAPAQDGGGGEGEQGEAASLADSLERCRELLRRPTPWQCVIHGTDHALRAGIFEEILSHKGPKAAVRYALCGTGDQATVENEQAHVSPRGCGSRLCPRCGSRTGKRLVRRVMEWLARAPHGDIFAFCGTQPVIENEPLVQARARMVQKMARYWRELRELNVTAAMVAVHCIVSGTRDGWHYHVHYLLEFREGEVTPEQLRALWQRAALPEMVQADPNGCKKLLSAGDAIAEAEQDQGDLDFWSESPSAIVRAVQYPIRDMAQGISSSRLGGDSERQRRYVAELLEVCRSWRMRWTRGRWSKKPPEKETPATGTPGLDEALAASRLADARCVPGPRERHTLGSIDRLYWMAQRGSFVAFFWFVSLERATRNSSEHAARLVKFCATATRKGPPRGEATDG